MSKLQILYSKEFARELGKIAVYLPGTSVEIGDIIRFPHGKTFFGKSRPLGSFQKVTSLKNLDVFYSEPNFSNTPDTYHFASVNSVDFNTQGKINLENQLLPIGSGEVKISFSSEGAIYFLGVECDTKQLDDLGALENEVNTKGKNLPWEDTYLVVSVTIAKKAFIAQSRSKNSELVVQGNIQGIQTGNTALKSNAKINISKQQGDVFTKDWSNDVTVFMGLVKFEKKIFEKRYRGAKSISKESEVESRILLKPITLKDIL